MNRVILDKVSALPAMNEGQVQYRGYTIRWTGFNERPPKGYPRGTKLGHFVAHIEDKHGDNLCDIGYYQTVSLRPGKLDSAAKMQIGARSLLAMMDDQLNRPQDQRDGWYLKEPCPYPSIYCTVKGHCHTPPLVSSRERNKLALDRMNDLADQLIKERKEGR